MYDGYIDKYSQIYGIHKHNATLLSNHAFIGIFWATFDWHVYNTFINTVCVIKVPCVNKVLSRRWYSASSFSSI